MDSTSASSSRTGPLRSSTRVKASASRPPSAGAASPAPRPPKATGSRATPVTASASSSSRSLRPRRSGKSIYEISVNSSDDDDEDDDKDGDSYNHGEYQDQEDDGNVSQETQETHEPEDEEEDDDEAEVERPERGSEAGRALRPRGTLATPAQLAEYVDINKALSNRKRTAKKKKKKPQPKKAAARRPGRACQPCRDSRRRCDGQKPRCTGCVKAGSRCLMVSGGPDDDQEWTYGIADGKEFSVRTEIRKTLEDTRRRRDNFYIKYKHLFEPLLPERNYISKLLGARAQETAPTARDPDADPAITNAGLAAIKEGASGRLVEGGAENPDRDGPPHKGPDTYPNRAIQTGPVDHRAQLEVRDAIANRAANSAVDGDVEVVPYKLLEKQPEKYEPLLHPVPMHSGQDPV